MPRKSKNPTRKRLSQRKKKAKPTKANEEKHDSETCSGDESPGKGREGIPEPMDNGTNNVGSFYRKDQESSTSHDQNAPLQPTNVSTVNSRVDSNVELSPAVPCEETMGDNTVSHLTFEASLSDIFSDGEPGTVERTVSKLTCEEPASIMTEKRNEYGTSSDELSDDAKSTDESLAPTQDLDNVLEDLEAIVVLNVDLTVLKETQSKIELFLPTNWMSYVRNGCIHVTYMSRKVVQEVQRQIVFTPNGKVGLVVHGQQVNISSYLTLPNAIKLSLETVDKFVDTCVKIVQEVRSFEICSGLSDVEFKSVWKHIPNARIDTNPYKEDRYSETLRSIPPNQNILVHVPPDITSSFTTCWSKHPISRGVGQNILSAFR